MRSLCGDKISEAVLCLLNYQIDILHGVAISMYIN